MPFPVNAKTAGRDAISAPLSNRFSRLVLPKNAEHGLPNKYFNGGDVAFIPIRPTMDREGVTDNKAPKAHAKEVNLSKMLRGGGEYLGD